MNITESVGAFVIDTLKTILQALINAIGAPVAGTFKVPYILFQFAEVLLNATTAIFPALLIWFIWRQVKS